VGDEEVFHDLLLAVDPDTAADEISERDPVLLTIELQVNSLVLLALFVEALAEASVGEEFNGALLKHAGAHAVDGVRAAAVLHDLNVDAGLAKKVRHGEAGRTAPDDSNLGG